MAWHLLHQLNISLPNMKAGRLFDNPINLTATSSAHTILVFLKTSRINSDVHSLLFIVTEG